jgi:hypothetical protein
MTASFVDIRDPAGAVESPASDSNVCPTRGGLAPNRAGNRATRSDADDSDYRPDGAAVNSPRPFGKGARHLVETWGNRAADAGTGGGWRPVGGGTVRRCSPLSAVPQAGAGSVTERPMAGSIKTNTG